MKTKDNFIIEQLNESGTYIAVLRQTWLNEFELSESQDALLHVWCDKIWK